MGLTHPGCKKKNGIDGLISFYVYNGFMQRVIKSVKYRLATDVFKEFCQIIQPEVTKKFSFYKQLLENGFLQPVPLHSTKLKIRGFNQAAYIGNFFNTILRLPIIDSFERAKETLPQAEIREKKDRYLNIKGAFRPKKDKKIKTTVVIIDDVITTGFTILELTKALKKNGAQKVFALTLARG